MDFRIGDTIRILDGTRYHGRECVVEEVSRDEKLVGVRNGDDPDWVWWVRAEFCERVLASSPSAE